MALGEFKPGDKIATCPYCQTIVDLPDQPTGTHETVVEEEEETTEDGKTTRRTVRRVTRTTGTSSGSMDLESMIGEAGILSDLDGDVQARVQAMFDQTRVQGSESGDLDRSHQDLRAMADELLSSSSTSSSMTQQTVHSTHTTTRVEEQVSEVPPKKSFWRRLFRKK